jgi:hypothetical protein
VYQPSLTIPPGSHEQLLAPRLTRLRSPHLSVRLLLALREVLGSEAGPETAGRVVVQLRLLRLRLMPGMGGSVLRTIGVVDHLFDLLLDLLLGDGAVGHGRVL